jgi:hypothetical protein
LAEIGALPTAANVEQPSAQIESARSEPEQPQNPMVSAAASTEMGKAVVAELEEDAEPATQAPEFSNVTIKNPFGDGDIQIEEISLSDLPALPELSGMPRRTASTEPVDQHSQSVTDLREGD